MAADDRALRDRLEQLQAQVRGLREQLDDPSRLDAVRAEVREELKRLQLQHAVAQGRLEELRPKVEDARMRSMQAKREREEQSLARQLWAAARLSAGLGAAVLAASFGAAAGDFLHLGLPAAALCAGSGAGLLLLVFRMARELRG